MSHRRLVYAAISISAVIAVAASVATNGSAVGKAQRIPSSILLITVDTLRADRVSALGEYERSTTPEIDQYFADGEIYTRAYSAEANTSPSVVSILSGLYPPRHGVRLLYQLIEPKIRTLPDVLREAGFQTAAVVSNVVLTAEAIGLDGRFEHYDDLVTDRYDLPHVFERKATATTDAAVSWLTKRRDDTRPLFLWVHYIDPHGPYAPPAEFAARFTHTSPEPLGDGFIQEYQKLPGVSDARVWIDRYDAEVAYVDAEIGRLLEEFDRQEDGRGRLVILTADHGETMNEHERYFTHGYHVWEPIVRVPLLIRRTGASAKRIETAVSTVDLMPTILSNVGIPIPPNLDGVPLSERSEQSRIFSEATGGRNQQKALIRGREKWFVTVHRRHGIADKWTLNLRTGPEDRDGATWRAGPEADALLESVRADPDRAGLPKQYEAGLKRNAPKIAPGRSKEQTEALQALGYIE